MKILACSDDATLAAEVQGKASEFGEVIALDGSNLPDNDSSTVAAAIAQIAESQGCDLVFLGATKLGKDVAPRVAALLDLPYAAEISALGHGEHGFTASRMVLSGNSKASYVLGARAVVTATPKTFEANGAASTSATADVPASKVQVLGTVGAGESDFDLSAAQYVVGVGRGFKAQADIKLAEELAAKLPGGVVGCSRPVTADLKWLGEEHWIGLSGHEIKPKIYFAAGVSGQIQHVAGIRGSKIIVAINTNKDAPIFQIADYGIVGDLYAVLPKLTAAL
jgi:electron transfer flavoprotein alpha subunit